MQAKYTGKIVEVVKKGDAYGDTKLKISCKGKVDSKNLNAQETSLEIVAELKSLIADNLKIGTVLTITLSDEDFKSDKIKEWAE